MPKFLSIFEQTVTELLFWWTLYTATIWCFNTAKSNINIAYLIRRTTCSTWCSLKTNTTKIFCKTFSKKLKQNL